MRPIFILCTAIIALGFSSLAIAQDVDLDNLREQAESGDPDAQFALAYEIFANTLTDGITTEEAVTSPILAEACNWAKKSGYDGGHAEALNLYASCVSHGYGQKSDPEKALAISEQAAKRGSVGAKLTLWQYYTEGNSLVTENKAKAFAYLLSAATGDGKHPPDYYAQWKLGMAYLEGNGVEKDSVEAYKWVKSSSEGGDVLGMISRAVMLATGDGVAEDDVEARKWYEIVALSDDVNWAHGLRGLGYMMFTGEGGPVDKVTGYGYLLVAEAGEDENAKTLVELYEKELTDDQIKKSYEIAEQWLDDNQ